MREIARTNPEPERQQDCVTEISFRFRRVTRNAPLEERPPHRTVGKILAAIASFFTAFLVPVAKVVKEIRGVFS
jgi:hypothetical protein